MNPKKKGTSLFYRVATLKASPTPLALSYDCESSCDIALSFIATL